MKLKWRDRSGCDVEKVERKSEKERRKAEGSECKDSSEAWIKEESVSSMVRRSTRVRDIEKT
jgi:hypothetical protein